MIGVIVSPAQQDVVREFFELFKTPWEFYREHRHYDVLLTTEDGLRGETATLVVSYAGRRLNVYEQAMPVCSENSDCSLLVYQGERIPIYGDVIRFPHRGGELLTDEDSQGCAAYLDHSGNRVMARIGYDLFGEVRRLLTVGQPPANAHIPTLELHIALLRNLINECGIPLVEIPPVPEGHRFIACLTHDVDHPSVRQHKWDHTTFGFLYRAVFGSLRSFLQRRMALRDLVRNWAATLKLPFVHMNLAKDFWRDFDDRYLELEKGIPSTFFVIPFKNYSGVSRSGQAPTFRAARYAAKDIAGTIKKLIAGGCEVGAHGLDAWLDSSRGREELNEIRGLTGVSEIGVRMHWLYYDEHSASILEKAGAAYDSTVGYNETVGYRAGTTQVYKPLQATHLLELPLHAMDTALFYPSHLGLSPSQAREVLDRMIENAVRFGGCLTINWHDRSIFPERLWETSYRDLLEDLKARGAWFSTAGEAVSWFRKRRAAVFEMDSTEPCGISATAMSDHEDNRPQLRLRIHNALESCQTGARRSEDYVDMPCYKTMDTHVASGADA
jgi:peptidoglycan/xylan/chitin deacetylase (PgdA/CDA1 family)